MRMLMTVHIPHEPFNGFVREGTVGTTIRNILDETRPEAVYFTEQNGERGAVMIVDVPKPSAVPGLAEPWFLKFNADCEFRIVMTPDDLVQAELDKLGRMWK